jgi:hypothetical protein
LWQAYGIGEAGATVRFFSRRLRAEPIAHQRAYRAVPIASETGEPGAIATVLENSTPSGSLAASAARCASIAASSTRRGDPAGIRGELIDCGAPVRKLLFVETLGHTRAPLACAK